jgi:hypothetical protein
MDAIAALPEDAQLTIFSCVGNIKDLTASLTRPSSGGSLWATVQASSTSSRNKVQVLQDDDGAADHGGCLLLGMISLH